MKVERKELVHFVSIFLALTGLMLGGCAGTADCWVTNANDIPELDLPPSSDSTPAVFLLRALYDPGFERGTVTPITLFDEVDHQPMGIEYCTLVAPACQEALAKGIENHRDGRWSISIEALVEYSETSLSSACPSGTVKILKLLKVGPSRELSCPHCP